MIELNNQDSTWDMTTLGELCSDNDSFLQTGPFGSQLHASDYTEISGIPVIMPANIGHRTVNIANIKRIKETDAKRLEKHRVKEGDIVYARRGNIGSHAFIKTNQKGWLCGTGCLLVRVNNDRILPEFISFYLLQESVTNWILRHAVGTTMANLNTTILSKVPVIIPPLSEQKAIASILGSLDDKIELNNKMNETLETMARALYKSWFVDFDPVVAKAAGKRPFGMDDETAALFPDKFVDSELGPIPEGWEIQKLDSFVKLIPGRSYTSKELQESKVALVTLKSFQRGGGYRTGGLKPYTGKYSEDQIVKTGDLVVARTDLTQAAEVIGRPALIENCENYPTLVASLDLLVVRPDKPEHLYFYHELLNSSDYINHALGYANGTTVLHLHKDALPDYRYVKAPDSLVSLFCNQVDQYYSLIISDKKESQTLSQLRDLLLPKLISGEIRIKNAEKVVEEAL